MTKQVILGVDPGVTGAISVFADGEFFAVYDLPLQAAGYGEKKRVDICALQDLLRDIARYAMLTPHAAVYLEHSHAMPRQGVSSMFAYGRTSGIIEASLYAAGLVSRESPPARIVPAAWKRRLNILGNGKPKDADLKLARKLYPDAPLSLKKHHNRADAILIGRYGCLMEKSRR